MGWIAFAALVLAVMASPLAEAEMFGPGFRPCGDETSTLAVVECVQAKSNAADQQLNAAYKGLRARIDAYQRQPLLRGATPVGPIPGRQLRPLRSTGRVDPAGAGSRMHPLY
jgi:uncharacterized protein YecT (DUF1311 family)